MADESRKIILEIDLDLKDLNTKAASLGREVTILKKKQDELKTSGQAGSVQFEENATKLRGLQTEYKNTQKQTDLLTKFNSAAEGSYEKLLRKQQLEQTQLKLLEGTLKRNANGTFELTEEYKKQSAQVDQAKDALINFDQGIKDGRSNVGNYSSVLKGLGGNLGNFSGQLGGLSGGFQSLKGGLDTAKLGFTTLRGAIIATGIGALLIAFTSLVTFFSKTTAGADLLGKATAGVGAAFQVIVKYAAKAGEFLVNAFENPKQAVKDLGDFIYNNIINRFKAVLILGEAVAETFKGNFKKAAQLATDGIIQLNTGIADATNKFKNFGNEILDAASKAAALADELDNLEVAQSNNNVAAAEGEKRISRLLLASKNKNLSQKESIALLEQAEEIERRTSKASIDLAKKALDIEIRSNKLKQEDGDEQLKRENELRVKVIELEKADIDRLEKIQNRKDALNEKAKADAEKAAKEEADRLEKLAKDENALIVLRSEVKAKALDRDIQDETNSASTKINLIAERIQAEIDAERQKNLLLLKGKEQASAEYQFIQLQETEKIKEIQFNGANEQAKIFTDSEKIKRDEIKKTADLEEASLKGSIGVASSTFGTLSKLAKKGSQEAKALAITQGLIETYSAGIAAYKSAASIPYVGFVLGPIAGAAAIAAGLVNVKNIKKMEKGGVIGGKPHSQGGTKFYGEDGSRFEAEAGELLTIVNKKDTKKLGALSRLNSGSGNPFFQDGGIYSPGKTFLADGGFAARSAGQPVLNSLAQNSQIIDLIQSLPAPEVLVKHIRSGLSTEVSVKERATV